MKFPLSLPIYAAYVIALAVIGATLSAHADDRPGLVGATVPAHGVRSIPIPAAVVEFGPGGKICGPVKVRGVDGKTLLDLAPGNCLPEER
jgi:hypothetical protein